MTLEARAGELRASFASDGFILGTDAARTLALAEALEKPLLVEGPPGVGKTDMARLWAKHHDTRLVRLQCYEGLDESRALYEWSYGKQVLYSQLLRDHVRDVTGDAASLGDAVRRLSGHADAFFSETFLLARPILEAIRSPKRVVLLIDEVDRSDEEFEAFLLETLSEFQVTVPELGTIRATETPLVVLTSNDTRDLAAALRRRCLYLYVDYPTVAEEIEILAHRAPALAESFRAQLAHFVSRIRSSDVKQTPGISETIDWALALVAAGVQDLTNDAIRDTLGALIKNREDRRHVLDHLGGFRSGSVS